MGTAGAGSEAGTEGPKAGLAHQDLFAIQRETHVRIRDAHIAEPGTGFGALRWLALTEDDEDRQPLSLEIANLAACRDRLTIVSFGICSWMILSVARFPL